MSAATQDASVQVARRLELGGSRVSRLERMMEIRLVEDRIQELFAQGLIPGTTHTSQGQEAVAVGLAAATLPTDVVSCTYRGHGVALGGGGVWSGAVGILPSAVLGEVLGREIGCMGGLGGSMHLSDPGVGLLPTFAIVGAGLPIAVGAALSFATTGRDGVAVSVFGDGATNIGAFHEALNLAKVWNLPVVFVCENNLYGEYSPIATTTAVTEIAARARAFDMTSDVVDGQDVDAVYDVVASAVARARAGDGPTLVEAKTYRYVGHSRSDQATYRPAGELEAWQARDPVELFAAKLVEDGALSAGELDEVRLHQRRRIDDAQEEVLASPAGSVPQMFAHVFAR
jgi:acetoin:2,6-dichlorophenolindophenol oxidoreductase subunit alpha